MKGFKNYLKSQVELEKSVSPVTAHIQLNKNTNTGNNIKRATVLDAPFTITHVICKFIAWDKHRQTYWFMIMGAKPGYVCRYKGTHISNDCYELKFDGMIDLTPQLKQWFNDDD